MADKEDQLDEAMVERLAVYFLNEFRARGYLPPTDSLNYLSDFSQEDWRHKARAALLVALNKIDGSVVSAARGTETRPEPGDATDRPGLVTTTRAAIERQVAGALKSCVDAHGPITTQFITSAAKRVVGALNISESEEA